MSRKTINALDRVGSLVFESAVLSMGIEENIARVLLGSELEILGMSEEALDIELLGALMPKVDERVRLFLSPDEARNVMRRLNSFILNWEEMSDEPKQVEAPVNFTEFEVDDEW